MPTIQLDLTNEELDDLINLLDMTADDWHDESWPIQAAWIIRDAYYKKLAERGEA